MGLHSKGIQAYLQEKKEEVTMIQREIAALEHCGLDMMVETIFETWKLPRVDFEIRDYSLADRVQFRVYCPLKDFHYDDGQIDHTIDFIHDVITPHINFTVYCRHEGWHQDKMRYARTCTRGGEQRQDIDTLCSFYSDKGVKAEVVEQLRNQLEELYRNPPPPPPKAG